MQIYIYICIHTHTHTHTHTRTLINHIKNANKHAKKNECKETMLLVTN